MGLFDSEDSDTNLGDATSSNANDILNIIDANNAPAPINPHAEMLSALTGSNRPEISTQQIRNPKNTEERAAKEDYHRKTLSANPVQPFDVYYPGETQNILKGTYSGSVVGSNPLFAPTGLYPYGLIDARQSALQAAADQKASEMDAFRSKILTQRPTTTRTNVQPQITQDFYKGINDFAEKHNGDYKAVYQDPEFQKWFADQNDRVANETAGVNSLAKFHTETEKPGFIKFAPQQQFEQQYLSGEAEKLISSTDPEDRAKGWQQMKMLHNLKSFEDPQKVVEEVVTKFQPDDIEKLNGVSKQELYDMITTKETKGTKNPEAFKRLNDHLDELYDQKYGDENKWQTGMGRDQFKKLAISQFGNTEKVTIQTPSTREAGGEEFKMDESSLSKDPIAIMSHVGTEKGTGSFGLMNSYGIPAKSQKEFEMPVPHNAKDISGTIVQNKTTGNVTAKVAQVGNAIVVHKNGSVDNGKLIDPKDIDTFKKNGFTFTVEPKASITVQGYDNKGHKDDAKNGTIAVGLSSIENNVTQYNRDGSYKSGVNAPLLERLAKEQEDKLNSTQKSERTKVTTKAQYDALPVGTPYIDSKGNNATK